MDDGGYKGMRDIKFRAYDTETKEMSYDFLDNAWLKVAIHSPYVELMQYTGLKDRNGREIYEGDIVQHREENGTIEYHSETAMFVVEFDTWITDFDHINGCDLEVIGNVYANPELLEVSNDR